jgi:uncharacterized protein (DUF3084 family)
MSISTFKSTAAITTSVVFTGIILCHRNVISNWYNKYRGIQGIVWYIWIGDYLPPDIRKAMGQLDSINEDMNDCESQLEGIEISVQRAVLDSVDGPAVSSDEIMDGSSNEELQIQTFQQNPELRKDIGFLSTRLDKLAAQIDSVLSHSDDEVKNRKKELSNKVVGLMDEIDKLIAIFHLVSNVNRLEKSLETVHSVTSKLGQKRSSRSLS